MGKSRQWRRTENQRSAMAKPAKPPSDPELAALREKILPLIKNLVNEEPAVRVSATNAISTSIEETKCRKLLLREQLVKILLEQTFTDQLLEVRAGGWGILRSLALKEDSGFSIHLYRLGILTLLQKTIQSIVEIIESKDEPFSKSFKSQQDAIWSLSGSVIGTVTSLAEAGEEICQELSQAPGVINFIFGLLAFDSIHDQLFNDCLSSLAALTLGNEYLGKKIIDHESWLKGLMDLREYGGDKAIRACLVLHNIFTVMEWWDHVTPIDGFSDACLIPTLMQCIDQIESQENLTKITVPISRDQSLGLALDIIASIATSLQEALEHVGSIEEEFKGFGDTPEDIDDAMEEDDDEMMASRARDKDMDDEEMDADMDLVLGADEEDRPLAKNQSTLDSLVHTATPKILLLLKSLSEESKDHDEVKPSALSALNNIAWTVSCVDFATCSSSISKTWATLAQKIWSEVVTPVLAGSTADVTLASLITTIAWAVARSVQGKVKLQGDEQRKFMALYEASKKFCRVSQSDNSNREVKPMDPGSEDPFQSLSVKCIGVLGRLALHPAPLSLNREVGIFLITILSRLPETPAADCVEALDQIYDIYADKEYEHDSAVFWADGFYKHLEAIAPRVKQMVKSIDKRKERELRIRADEAVQNLGRFLAYKRKERASQEII